MLLAGRYFSMGSSRLTKPCLTMSAKTIVTNVFAMDAMSKTVFPSTFVSLELEIFPYPETWVPFVVTMPTTIGTRLEELLDNCLNTISLNCFKSAFDSSFLEE